VIHSSTSRPSSTDEARANAYSAIEAHYRKNYKRLVNQSVGRTSHHSRQEAYTVALENWSVLTGELDNWLSVILKNCLGMQRRQDMVRSSVEGAEASLVSEPAGYWTVRLNEVKELINRKDDDTSRLLTLVFLDQLPYRTVAILVKESEVNIRKIAQRFREELTVMLR
jgi:DNA-directed RNA polymerase specialized sigma24 family protein